MLKGVGAGALLWPFLGSAALSGRASAQKNGSGKDPREPDNLLLVTWPCGLEPGWEPSGSGVNYQLAPRRVGLAADSSLFATEPALQGLVSAHRDRLLIATGLQSGVEDPMFCHSQGPTSMWTGWGGAGERSMAVSSDPSVDQWIAARIGIEAPIPSLHLGVLVGAREVPPRLGLPNYHFGSAGPVDVMTDPLVVYSQIFQGILAGRLDLQPIAERRSLFDFLENDITRLTSRIASEDRPRLEQHLERIRELERAFVPDPVTCQPPAEPDGALSGLGANQGKNGVELTRQQAALIALAFRCGLTKVATLQLGRSDCMYTAPYDGATSPVHVAAHATGQAAQITRAVTARYMLDRLGDVLSALAAIEIGAGQTLLDTTLVVMSSDMGSPSHGTNVPVLIAGGSKPFFKQGEYVALQGEPRVNRLLVTLLRYYGFPDETFGSSATGNFRGAIDELTRG
jgi:hypothetical protein